MAQSEDGNRQQPRKGGADFIKQFDKDGDGKVSQAEFNGPAGPFAHMDKNGDGFISEDEAPKGPPPRRGNDQQGSQKGDGFVKRLDKDADGKVSLEEFDGPADHFSHMDKNGDGFISEDEAPTGPPPGKGKGGRP